LPGVGKALVKRVLKIKIDERKSTHCICERVRRAKWSPKVSLVSWQLSLSAMKGVIPTFVSEPSEDVGDIEGKIAQMAILSFIDLGTNW
jgi:hypothetical protein